MQRLAMGNSAGRPRRPFARRLASLLLLAVLPAGVSNVAPLRAGAAVASTPLRTRDIGGVPVTCNGEVFIASLNNDDDNNNDTPDLGERLSLRENNLREFIFDVPEATKVYIAEVALIPSNEIAVGTRVRAYEQDKKTKFRFGDRDVPVTMYLEGKKQSPSANDIGFEYQYFKEDGSTVCGGFVQGTVVRADATLDVDSGRGSPFSRHHKMLITGEAAGAATVAPAGLVAPQWSYDAPGALFTTPTELATNFTAPETFTPRALIGQARLRLILTATATNPASLVIEANVPVNLTAPRRLKLRDKNEAEVSRRTGLMKPSAGRFDLFDWLIDYDILDQTRESIRDSAYAGQRPQAKENIADVLTSQIDAVRQQITLLEHDQTWTAQSDGVLADHISALDWPKGIIVDNGRFHPILRSEGGILMHIAAPNTHIWELSVGHLDENGVPTSHGVVQATHNRFISFVFDVEGPAAKIDIKSRYRVVLP